MQRLQAYTHMVWTLPGSLAATTRIVFTFFSWRYLDVSIPLVRLLNLCIQLKMTGYYPDRVPPFGNPWFKAYSRLPMAYRRVSRLSSPLTAKASTKRPFRAWFDPENVRRILVSGQKSKIDHITSGSRKRGDTKLWAFQRRAEPGSYNRETLRSVYY